MKKRQLEISYHNCKFDELTSEEQQLVEEARQATFRSYSPYSHFSVGASVLLANGVILSGSNQENAAYPSGLCAERTVLFYANSQYPNQPITMMAIAARSEKGFTEIPITPCGACRQVLAETERRFEQPIRILLYGETETIIIDGVKDLLPFLFDEDILK
ncbi:MAG: cytidine deaminase [Bacteroidaceae bacterium]|nr:cytidine deaminase [Bacteroidaceae bacterium]